jgi:hypothetical protein
MMAGHAQGKLTKPVRNSTKKVTAPISTISAIMNRANAKTSLRMNLKVSKTAAIAKAIAKIVDHPNQKNTIARTRQIKAAILHCFVSSTFYVHFNANALIKQ